VKLFLQVADHHLSDLLEKIAEQVWCKCREVDPNRSPIDTQAADAQRAHEHDQAQA
jgi:hypothetical protein